MSEFIGEFRELVRKLEISKHPLCEENDSLKMMYATGLALLLFRSGDVVPDELSWLSDFLISIALPEEHWQSVQDIGKSADATILNELKSIMDDRKVCDRFFLDLKEAAELNSSKSAKTSEMVELYRRLILPGVKWGDRSNDAIDKNYRKKDRSTGEKQVVKTAKTITTTKRNPVKKKTSVRKTAAKPAAKKAIARKRR